MSGESADVARAVGRDAWQIFGRLAADRAAPLHEVTKRCLRWCDAASVVVAEAAARHDVPGDVLDEALAMLRRSLHVTLVRMCESFEEVRQQADEQLALRQEELAFIATHDTLTHLPNRALVLDRVAQMMARARRTRVPVAALHLDLDDFKTVNDTLGHDAGDELLRSVAARLDGLVRPIDVLGRLGSDEFVVVADGLALGEGAELVAERLIDTVAQPFLIGPDRKTVTMTASIGLAVGSERGTPDELLRDADIAMYRAKRDGKRRYATFERGMHQSARERAELGWDLRDALARDQFLLVYQPTVDLHTMRPTGVEALLRWDHPTRGLVGPVDFIPMLEETGAIVEIGRWALGAACEQAAAWRRDGLDIEVAVNVSARQLDRDVFVDEVRAALRHNDLEPTALKLEVTETALMRNVDATAALLEHIKALGVRIAIDDFGTGYSSLGHLRRFPVDALKIDRSFISCLASNREGETLVRTLVELGKALAIETLAEGIETDAELSFLRSVGCDRGQGFLFARPQVADAAERLLRTWPAARDEALGHEPSSGLRTPDA